MSDDQEKHDECKMTQTDSEGNTNLCCCYILDQDGRHEDPCYLPVDDCCRGLRTVLTNRRVSHLPTAPNPSAHVIGVLNQLAGSLLKRSVKSNNYKIKAKHSAFVSMTGGLSNWKYAIASLKLPPIDTDATALPLGETVADLENALSVNKGSDNIIELIGDSAG